MLMLILVAVLCGCHKEKQFDGLQRYINKVKSASVSTVKDLPEFFKVLSKSNEQLNHPASKNNKKKQITFEHYSVLMLTLAGVLIGSEKWALIRAPNQAIEKVQLGTLVGKEHARVAAISDSGVKLQIIKGDDKHYVLIKAKSDSDEFL